MYVVLPGFLGHRNDWLFLKDFHYTDIFCSKIFDPEKGFSGAANIIPEFSNEKILLGYSLGGRLALHALIERPHAWKAAVIVSAHFGLANEEEKQLRIKQDEHWACRFEKDPWEFLLNDWNLQEVFRGFAIDRKEEDFSRETLAKILRGWSLGRQENLKHAIEQLDLPILWVTGQEDVRFTALVKNLKFLHPLSRGVVIKNAAHRVIWEQKDAFLEELKDFERDLEGR